MADHPLPYDLIIFDADGTLRGCTVEGQPCPNKRGEWYVLPNVAETLSNYDWDTTGFGIASNQGGVALGYVDHKDAMQMLKELALETAKVKHPIVLMCTHAPNTGCPCRKPSPLMINHIVMFYGPMLVDGDAKDCRVLYVGDMLSDQECAVAAGVDFMWAQDFFGWNE